MSKKKNMPNTYVGLPGTQPSKNGNKQTKRTELWTSKRTLSSRTSLQFLWASVSHENSFFFFQYNHLNLLAEGALEKQNMKK